MDIGVKLFAARKSKGLSQQEIADKVGVSKATISRWESGKIDNMGIDKVPILAQALDMTPEEILDIGPTGHGSPNENLYDYKYIVNVIRHITPEELANVKKLVEALYPLKEVMARSK